MSTTAPSSRIVTPDWVKDAVFYQIFPDRFAKSARLDKPSNLLPWDAKPTVEGYMGGDLLGLAEHLDYLDELGVNAIYLNPIFQSASNHRYHTHDYYQVDPLLGGNEALRELVQASHRRGIRIVLDGVFNHASRGFFQFNDILEHGPHSAWVDWFLIQDWPLSPYDGKRPANYVGWADNRALPKFNTDNPQVREFIMRVAEFWLREYGIDGWRLDVPAEIKTPGFWEEFRQRVKAVNPDAYIVAEIWRDAREWLQGEHFDATMNYEFTAATIAFAAREEVPRQLTHERDYEPYPSLDAPGFGERIQRVLNLYDWQITLVQLNLLDSHDTARMLSLARGDKSALRLATIFQMTYPGAPCVYYGDEIALRGTEDYAGPLEDADARRPFPWHDHAVWDMDMLGDFKALIALRHAHRALRRGHFYQLYARGYVYAFVRRDDNEALVVVLNAGDDHAEIELPVGAYFHDGTSLATLFGPDCLCTVQDGQVQVTLPARDGLVLGMR